MRPLLKTAQEDVSPEEAHIELMQRHIMDESPPDEEPDLSRMDRLQVNMGQPDPERRYKRRNVDSDTLVERARESDSYGPEYLQKLRAGEHEDLPLTPIGQRK